MHRGMKTGGGKTSIRTKYKRPKAKRDWSLNKRYNKEPFKLHTVSPKKPKKEEIEHLRKTKRVRVEHSPHARLGYRVNANFGEVVGRYGIYIAEKTPRKSTKRTSRKRKK